MKYMANAYLRYGFFTLLLAAVFISSCHKQDGTNNNDFLLLDKTTLRLDTSTGSSGNITVHSSVAWKATISPGANVWLKLDKTSGNTINTIITLSSIANNGTVTPQTATVTFSPTNGGNLNPVILTVTQKPFGFTIGYSKTFGGASYESARSVNSPDGGIVMAGTTSSVDGDIHGSHGNQDAWIVKLNSTGDTVWTRTMGGSAYDVAADIIASTDGGYVITGATTSNDGDITDKRPGFDKDVWVIKLDGNGHTTWAKTFGGSGVDAGYSIISTSDGGYMIAGISGSNNGDIPNQNHGGGDVLAMKLNSQGNLQWSKVYGGSDWDEAHRIVAAADGYVIAGLTYSSNGDVTGYHVPVFTAGDMLIMKIDLNGNKIWAKAFGGTLDEDATALTATSNGYVVAGYTNSIDGDVKGKHGTEPLFYDMWALKVNDEGNIIWAKTFGGLLDDAATEMAATPDGGFILTGASSSNDGDVSGNHNKDYNDDVWIIKLDADGNKQWAKTLGGSGDDAAYSITVNPGGYSLVGVTSVIDGDVMGNFKGLYDIWAIKIIVQ